MSPAPKHELSEMHDRLVREVERVIAATDGLTAERLVWTPAAKSANAGQAALARDLRRSATRRTRR